MNISSSIPFVVTSVTALSVRSPLRLGFVNTSGVLLKGFI